MAASEVQYGTVTGYLVSVFADGSDEGRQPDESPLNGVVVLSPSVSTLRVPGSTPPKVAALQELQCPVIDGWLCPPGSTEATQEGVVVAATDQPGCFPERVTWTVTFQLNGIANQPPRVKDFVVPAGGTVDLAEG